MQGILRGFDPFMNLVVDDSLEMGPGGQQHTIGMVVSTHPAFLFLCHCHMPAQRPSANQYSLVVIRWLLNSFYYKNKFGLL